MDDLLNNVKTLIPIIAAICFMAGFYFTTNHKLNDLEEELSEVKLELKSVKKSIRKKGVKSE